MREIRVNDGDFRSFPERDLAAQVLPGEFTVRYKDFKNGLRLSHRSVDALRAALHREWAQRTWKGYCSVLRPPLVLGTPRRKVLRPSEHACNYRYEHDGEIYNEDVEPDRCAYCFLPNE